MQLRGRECPMCRKYVHVVRPFPRFIEMDHSAYDDLKGRYDDLRGERYLLAVERNALKDASDALRAERDVMKVERDVMKVERDALQARINQLQAQLNEQKQRDLAVRMQTYEDRLHHLEAEREPLHSQLSSKLEEIELRLHTYRAEQARHEARRFGHFRTNPASSSPSLPSVHDSGSAQSPNSPYGIPSSATGDVHEARALWQHRFGRPT